MRSTILVSVLAAFVWACGSHVASELGDAMVDAGRAISDTDAASAQEVLDVPCDIERTRVRRADNDGIVWTQIEETEWYAEVHVDEARAGVASEVGGVVCGRESFDAAVDPCAAPWSCTGDTLLPELDCAPASPRFEDGVARVLCGRRVTTSSSSAPAPVTGGYRYTTARIFVR